MVPHALRDQRAHDRVNVKAAEGPRSAVRCRPSLPCRLDASKATRRSDE